MAAQAGLCLAWSETPEDTFCRVEAHMYNNGSTIVYDRFVFAHPESSSVTNFHNIAVMNFGSCIEIN